MLLVPYISPQQFYDSYGTTVDLSNYVPTGSSPSASVSLLALVRFASSIVDKYCKQQLRATVDTDTLQVWPTKDNTLRIWPKNRPIVSLASLQYRYNPTQGWSVVSDLTATGGVEMYPSYFEYSGYAFDQFTKVTVNYTYVNGFPITQTTAPIVQGATSFTVTNATGVSVGDTLTVYDDPNPEDVTVTGVNGNTISTTPFAYAHVSTGLPVSGMPSDVAEATGMIAANLITRGFDGHTVSGDGDFKTQYVDDSVLTADIKTMLEPYRVWL